MEKESYNSLTMLDKIPYNVISYLVQNNDYVFKLLKYNDANAWKNDSSHPNLALSEKGSLIYDGIKNQVDCRIFMDTGQDDSWQTESTQLRISVYKGYPMNATVFHLIMGIEVYSHYKVNTLSNYTTRDVSIIQSLIGTLNGAEVGGLGKLYFEGSNSKLTTIGIHPYKGKGITMCTHIV